MRKTGNNYSGPRWLYGQNAQATSTPTGGGLSMHGSSRKPRVLDTSNDRRGRLIGESITEHGVIKTVRWDDNGDVTREGDGNPDIIVLRD